MPEPELFRAPDDLTLVSDQDLTELETRAVAEFDRVNALTTVLQNDLDYADTLVVALDSIRNEQQTREDRATRAAASTQAANERRLAELHGRVHTDAGDGTEPARAAATANGTVDLAALTEATAAGFAKAFAESGGSSGKRPMASLSATQREAPKTKAPEQLNAVTASVDIPGVATGQSLPTLEALGEAFRSKAKAIPTTREGAGASRHLVASVKNQFQHTVDDRTNPAKIEELWRSMVQEGNRSTDANALVAGGGWCAPSQIMYDFFNISGAPKSIDLPTVGVSRGGIQFPTSPAIGDVFFQNAGSSPASGFGGFAFSMSNATDPWLWSETDDQLTVTGSVNKPTLRVPCPTFNNVRLECYGISLTAGNLTDDAYPESTQNFIRLLRSAYEHAINARLIALMVAASTAGSGTIGTAANAITPGLVNAAALGATDYRARFAMDEDAVLEAVYPYWVLEAMRSDLGYKPGIDSTALLSVVDAEITGLFTSRNVRPQFVSDWQVRGANQFGLPVASGIVAWPATVQFMLYAAGTFLHGTGLQLDLGVIRDSVLNAENDFTALWAEECHLVAKVGHESRLYTTVFNVGGNVAAGVTGAKV